MGLLFYFYGLEGFDRQWDTLPATLWMNFTFFISTVIGVHFFFLVAAIVLDGLGGPIFFRDEVAEMETILYTDRND